MDAAFPPAPEPGGWLEGRLAGIPTELAEAIGRLCVGSGCSSDPRAMAACALDTFERVGGQSQTRAGALELLAADALLTYAFEAAADPRAGGSAAGAVRLAREFGPAGELGRRAGGAR